MMKPHATREQWLRLIECRERIQQLHAKQDKLYGQACQPDLEGILDREEGQGQLNFTWPKMAEELDSKYNQVIREILADRPKPTHDEFQPITPDKLWMWGGPTPKWGGSMAEDCLVRETCRFHNENAVYVYGETSDKMMKLHAGFKKLLCQVNSNCRTDGMMAGTEEENAELLSKLSLTYPNIVGAMCDDFSTGTFKTLLPERYQKIYRGVKKYNDKLKVYGVVYAAELDIKNFDLIQPYIDVVNLWFWAKDEILSVDEYTQRARELFPGKPILMGLFIHEYGSSDLASPEELLIYQLERAGVMLKKGWLEGVVILGDREVRKWPKVTAALSKFLAEDQYKI